MTRINSQESNMLWNVEPSDQGVFFGPTVWLAHQPSEIQFGFTSGGGSQVTASAARIIDMLLT